MFSGGCSPRLLVGVERLGVRLAADGGRVSAAGGGLQGIMSLRLSF